MPHRLKPPRFPDFGGGGGLILYQIPFLIPFKSFPCPEVSGRGRGFRVSCTTYSYHGKNVLKRLG